MPAVYWCQQSHVPEGGAEILDRENVQTLDLWRWLCVEVFPDVWHCAISHESSESRALCSFSIAQNRDKSLSIALHRDKIEFNSILGEGRLAAVAESVEIQYSGIEDAKAGLKATISQWLLSERF